MSGLHPSEEKMSQSKPSAYIRIGHSLNEGEHGYVSRRREIVQKCLQQHNIKCSMDTVPNIALLGSGGGERAMLALLGSLVQLGKCDLLDCIMYLSGVSGSTWCMTSLYNEPKWSSKLDAVQNKIIKRLNESVVSWSDAWKKLKEYYKQEDNFSLTDVWATMFVTSIVKEIDNNTISNQAVNESINPYPIYTVIDQTCKQKKLNRDAWFEITPDEAGYSLSGAFVDIAYFGSQFENGNFIKNQPKIDMLYLQGVCGSALADMEEIKKWIWEHVISWFTQEQHSTLGLKVLLTVVELNICVLKKENPSDLIKQINVLLEGKLEKHEKSMNISAEDVHDRINQYTLYICENFEDLFEDPETDAWIRCIILQIIKLLLTWTWGTTYNFLYNSTVEDVDPSVLMEEMRYYEDAGLLINSPYFPSLRQERQVDLIISLDFSAGDPFATVVKTSEMCRELDIPFPEIQIPRGNEPEGFYVWEGENGAPTVIHIPLFNRNNCDGNIEEWEKRYQTFQRAYSKEMIIDLIEIAGKNVTNNKEKILTQIRHIIEKKKTK